MKRKVVILVVSSLIIVIAVFGIYNTPMWNDKAVLTETEFTFRGDRYKFVTDYPSQCGFKPDKHVAYSGGVFFGKTYSTVKDDEEKEYIYVSELKEKYVYCKVK